MSAPLHHDAEYMGLIAQQLQQTQPSYSILRGCQQRALPVALAELLAAVDHAPPYREVLARLYAALPAAQRAECQAELMRQRNKLRGKGALTTR